MRPVSRTALSFASDLGALGVDGFRDWLVRSFAGAAPQHELGRFQADDDALFGEVFRRVAHELPQAAMRTAADGVLAALQASRPDELTYYGLYEMAAVAEGARLQQLPEALSTILTFWLDPVADVFAKPPRTREDVICLREVMECAYRLMPGTVEDARASGSFDGLADWSHALLTERPYAAGRILVPAFAPIYMTALVAGDGTTAKRLMAAVRSGHLTRDDPYPDLFVFNAGGDHYPYALDALLRLGDSMLDSARAQQPLLRNPTDDIFSKPLASATHGIPQQQQRADLVMDLAA